MGVDTDRVDSLAVDGKRSIKSFVLRGSRLASYQKEALELYTDRFVIPFEEKVLDFNAIYGNDNPVIIEIGFGMGHTTERIATQMPLSNFLGIEVFLNGFSKLLSAAGLKNIQNLRLMRYDAVEVLEKMIGDGTIAGFHIFFPDPWPKKKHHKRRLVQTPFAELLAQKLAPNGYIYCVTDWEEYAYQMLDVFSQIDSLHNPHNGFSPPRSWRPTTGFEEKGMRKNHRISEVWVEKK
ncbi:tRNA (guanosine(46)-N7)-methyltransferase TrmB [Pleomorphochaeta sp. DL1XJH-081]|uniref:tRNA (guanosine(46)-N7)-methyltransferase TrmB n=1 Tax=Pleomorphochaeta sp. DL1XJH-081 TaxID=3409690 RepID=UPI003BB66919